MVVDQHLLRILRELYEDNTAQIKIDSRLSKSFTFDKGLRQGCSLSPLLFNLFVLIKVALRIWKAHCGSMGIQIGDETLFTFSFPNYQFIVAQDAYDLEFMLRRLYKEYEV